MSIISCKYQYVLSISNDIHRSYICQTGFRYENTRIYTKLFTYPNRRCLGVIPYTYDFQSVLSRVIPYPSDYPRSSVWQLLLLIKNYSIKRWRNLNDIPNHVSVQSPNKLIAYKKWYSSSCISYLACLNDAYVREVLYREFFVVLFHLLLVYFNRIKPHCLTCIFVFFIPMRHRWTRYLCTTSHSHTLKVS